MKKLLMFLFAIAFSSLSWGQTYLSESFEGTWSGTPAAPSGWSIIHTAPTGGSSGTSPMYWVKNTWSGSAWSPVGHGAPTTPTGAQNGSSVAWFDDYNAKATQKDQITTGIVDLSLSTNPRLTFYLAINASSSVTIKARGSNDGGSTWADIQAITKPGVAWTKIIVPITATYKVANAKFGIEVTTTYGSYDVWLDNFKIDETPSPLVGIKTIKNAGGDYSSFTSAINALNEAGVGTGGVTFNVDAGFVSTENCPAITINATLTNPVVFQKSGIGANPIIKAGVGTGSSDAIVILKGCNYVTFDGIDLQENSANTTTTQQAEYGFYVLNNGATDGAQNNTIKNSKITLNRTNTSTKAIYQYYGTTPTNQATGCNNNNKYYNLTVENTYNAVYLYAYSSTYFDSGTELGVISGGNTIIGGSSANDIGNGSSSTYGVYAYYQSGLRVFNTEIRNIGASTTAYGIYLSSCIGTTNLYNNKIHDLKNTSTSSTSAIYGIYVSSLAGTNPVANIYNNLVYNITSNYTGSASATRVLNGIYLSNSTESQSFNLYFNSIKIDGSTSLNVSSTCFQSTGTTTGGVLTLKNNIFANLTAAQTGVAKHYSWVSPSATTIGPSGSAADYNNLYSNGAGSGNGYLGLALSTDIADLGTWMSTLTGTANLEINSIEPVDPGFTPSLVPIASKLDGTGTTIATITTDITGATRNDPPDYGAYEFDPPNPCATPIDQPTAISLTSVSNTSISGTFTAAASAPDKYLVVRSILAIPDADPVDQTTYSVGSAIGSGVVVKADELLNFTATGLTAGTQYYFYVYSFNNLCQDGPLYNMIAPLSGNQYTLPNAPATFTATVASSSQINLLATANAQSNDIIVAWNSTSAFGTPTGTYNNGDPITGGGTILYSGSAAGLTNHASLTSATTYYYKVWSKLGTYYSSGLTANATTVSIVPFFEGFENANTHNTDIKGWSQESVSGTYNWTANNSLIDYNRTPRTGSWNAYLHYSDEQWMFKGIELTENVQYTFKMYARQDMATNTDANITVKYGNQSNAASMLNTIVSSTGIINGNYQLITGSFTPLTSGVFYIGIKGYMNGIPYYISIDDISIVQSTTPTVTTELISGITTNSANSGGNVTDDGGLSVTERGVCWSTSQNPTILDNKTINGSGNGIYTSSITGLSQGTLYYVRAYATNSLGTSYGSEISFTTNSAAIEPTVLTTAVTNIATTTASSGGNVTSDGGSVILERGICYSLSSNPTILDTKVIDLTASTGIFTSDINGLIPNTTYYVRAYATNAIGTSYGLEQSFITEPLISSFPYNQDFEGLTNEGWKTAINTGTLNEWVKGTPSKTQIAAAHSGTNAWITKLTGNYGSSAQYSLITPSFNFSALVTDPLLSFWHNFKTETGYDAGVIEYSIDNGATWIKVDATLGTGANFNTSKSTNWYNSSSTSGPIANPKWSGSSTAYAGHLNGWIQSKTVLTGLAGQTNVKLRFRFGSDVSGEDDGWAIDDFSVYLPTVASLTTTAHSLLTGNSFTSGGNITDNGGAAITEKGVCWSTSANPTILDNKTNDGSGNAIFTSNVAGLNANTLYYYRAYATNAIGTAYGNELSVITLSTFAPSITTNAISNLTNTTVTLSGEITADGGDPTISESGVVYSTTANPLIGGVGVIKVITNPLISDGSFNENISGLIAGTTYYYKAFATNNTATGYGTEVSFTTKSAPVVTTAIISNIETTTAIGGGNVTSDGGDPVTVRGICWSTTTSPTIANSFTTDGIGIGSYTSSMSGLIANGQTYYVRAYATNAYGTTYGTQKTFVTACDAQNIPYTQNFDGVTIPAIPSCMTVTDDNGISPNWVTSTGGVTGNAMKIGYTAAGAGPLNDWFFTPSLNLIAGKIYKVSFKYKGGSSSYVEKLEVKWGAGANATAMTSPALFSNISFYVANFQTVNAIFTPVSSGLYNVGWHAFSIEDQINIFVDDISITEYQALWTGAASGNDNDWATATNWDNGFVPTSTTNVIIPATAPQFPKVSALTTINNLTIESSAAGTGSLLDNGNLTITGTSTVKQYVVGDKWHMISSPVQNSVSGVFHLAAGQADIYIRQFNAGAWSYITNLTTPLVAGKGYSIWADTQTNSTPSPTIPFVGALNTGNQNISLEPNAWNLIGNPYTSAIDWSTVTDRTTNLLNGGAAYFWNQSIAAGAGGYATHDGTIAVNGATKYIPTMQGFFVKASSNSLGLSNANRVHNSQSIYKSTSSINDLLRITAKRGNLSDETVLTLNSNATNGFDSNLDAEKLFSNNNDLPEVYTTANNHNLVINRFGTYPAVIPMNIRLGVAGNVTLTASEFANFDATVNITLEDMLTGTTQDLRQNPTYTFAASIGENANRFVLHFATASGINEPNAGNISIYANENNIYVNTTEKVKEISVYNMLGQVITSVSGSAKSLQTISMDNASGNYVVKVTTEKGVKTEKVFVK